MAGKVKGTTFKISEKDARGYAYVGRRTGMRRNGGVTAIAAINGRGAYAANLKAREVTGGKSPSLARRAAAQVLKQATEEPLVLRMHPVKRLLDRQQGKYKSKVMKSLGTRSETMRTNPRRRKAASPAQLRARRLFAEKARSGAFKRKAALRRNPSGSVDGLRKNRRSAFRRNAQRIIPGSKRRSVIGGLPRYALPGEGIQIEERTRVMPRRSAKTRATTRRTKAPSAKATARAQETTMKKTRKRRKSSAAAKVTTAKRRIAKKKGVKKSPKRVARKTRRTAAQKKASLRNLRKARAAAKKGTKRVARKARKARKATRRVARKTRRTAAQKKASLRNLRKARAAAKKSPRRVRRTRRSKAAKATKAVRRTRRSKASKRKGRKYARNGRKHGIMRRNDTMGAFSTAIKVGTIAGIGFIGHKVATSLLNTLVIDKVVNKSVEAAAATPVTAPAAEGLGQIKPILTGLLGGGVTLTVGIMAANQFIESQDTKRLVTAGMVASFFQTLIVSMLERVAPQAAPMLSGGEASRMSAMYGVDPASILPRYAPINGLRGMGEYFAQTNGLGEYFEQTNGLGEYFAQSGLGNYERNPNLLQAAAGYGAVPAATNHIDPSSDLERELSIAEAAAGVGNIDYAAAGMGDIYQAAAGMGAIDTVPSASTVVPSGQLWAGTRSVTADDNSENPGGILASGGGGGIFG